MLPMRNGPDLGPVPAQQLQHGAQNQYTNPPQPYPSFPDTQGYFIAHTNPSPTGYPPPLTNPSQSQLYPLQPASFPYFPPNQEQLNQRHQTKAPTPQQPSTSRTSRSTTASEDEVDDTCMEEEILWQTVKGTKRKKHRLSIDPTSQAILLVNRYHLLTDPRNTATNTGTAEITTVKPPPPIFIYGVTNLPEMRKRINEFINEEHYTIKSLANNTIRLLCQNPDTFRKLAKYMKEKKHNPPHLPA